MTGKFSLEDNELLNILNKNNYYNTIFYLLYGKIAFVCEGEIKMFLDKQNFRTLCYLNSVQRSGRGFLQVEEKCPHIEDGNAGGREEQLRTEM